MKKGAYKSRLAALAEKIAGHGRARRPPLIVFANTPPHIVDRARSIGRPIIRVLFGDGKEKL